MEMTSEQIVAQSHRIVKLTQTEGWDDIVAWIDEQIELLTNRVMSTDEPMLKEKHEVMAWKKLKEKINSHYKIHEEAILNAKSIGK